VQKLTSAITGPTLDNIGLPKGPTSSNVCYFADVILTSPDTTSVFGQTSKVENVGR